MSDENGWYKKMLSQDRILLYRMYNGMIAQRFMYKRRGGVNPRMYGTFLNRDGCIEEYKDWRRAIRIFEDHLDEATLIETGKVEAF